MDISKAKQTCINRPKEDCIDKMRSRGLDLQIFCESHLDYCKENQLKLWNMASKNKNFDYGEEIEHEAILERENVLGKKDVEWRKDFCMYRTGALHYVGNYFEECKYVEVDR